MITVNFTKPFFLISDCHWFHSKTIFQFDNRPQFKSVEEMNSLMFDNWNKTVKPDDYIFHLGDWVVGHKDKYGTAQSIHDSLNGKKIFLKGNHDSCLKEMTKLAVCEEPLTILYKDKKVLISHRPIWDFDRLEYDCHLFGHIHNNKSVNAKIDHSCMKNLSVEMINFTPVHIDDILKGFERT